MTRNRPLAHVGGRLAVPALPLVPTRVGQVPPQLDFAAEVDRGRRADGSEVAAHGGEPGPALGVDGSGAPSG
jgi:hypothetical protein